MANKQTIVCFGPGPAFKGGLSDYNTSLAKAFDRLPETEVHIVSWTQQYPSIIPREFKDKVSRSDHLEGTNIKCEYITNYNNPFSWGRTARYIAKLKPDVVVFQWSIALQGLPVGRIINKLKKLSDCEVFIDLHFVIQKEQSKIDRIFTKMGISTTDSYIVHALKTYRELQTLYPNKKFHLTETGESSKEQELQKVIKLYHPIYDLFKPDPAFDVEAFKKEHGLRKHVFLFFGFIRKYKGLHHAIRAFDIVARQRDDASLLVCGESFWNTLDANSWTTRIKKALFGIAKGLVLGKKGNEQEYRPLDLVEELGLKDSVRVFNRFIPNEEVNQFFQTADSVVLFYETATPSGIESLSYNFDLPILATRVGHFPETVKDGFNGYLAEAEDINSMAEAMIKMLDHPLPAKNVQAVKGNMSWENYARSILYKTHGQASATPSNLSAMKNK